MTVGRRVVVTGLGLITPLGTTVISTWSRLLQSHCGIVSTRPLGPAFAALPSQVAGLVPKGPSADNAWTGSEHCTPTELRQTAKFAQYGLAAAAEALADAGYGKQGEGLPKDDTGVALGSGIGNLEELHDTSVAYQDGAFGGETEDYTRGYRRIHPLFVPRMLINLGAGHISMRYGLRGPNHAVTTACTTGAHSLGDAARFIQMGDAEVMLAGGAESCIHPLAMGGFARSRSLATAWNEMPEESSRPFDEKRAGFVIGEGAGVVVLEELEHAKKRGAKIYAELSGYGCSADAYHLTAPREDGSGALMAMKKALQQAEIKPEKVDYINAHATSTPLGDAAENNAIKALLLGEDGHKRASDINVSSTKGALGHLLGAAGAVEAIFAILAIHENTLPPTINVESLGPGFDCNYVANQSQQRQVSVALTNSFGFGGTNASLCFQRYPGT
ncbi:putative 3-oxoacyl-[acyl-carrier-protein] synthase, mitochondrial [Cyphellophora attinorum]|uniref:3-oxoacyl-[acyl-carrier-protein] synthase n=1 Tax=Cyphellophora attinorum TaxID=1664694 RepID=A0A0N1H487_9EURO|nr:putative 3-oxoacyl-[acyl-carrier-protein] synthase, mitochondrial [Phialophora attinorum]KPI39984.1 putative 3-oxoacyl-[acyl-carrier-protein] synthase, mitochondrial [Phialophora attinorum]